MTPFSALVPLLPAATSKSTSNPLLTLLPLLAIGFLAYFFFIRPQQRKAQAARKAQGSDIEVGDEVQTVGGVVGTVLEIHGDRYTVLTGALGEDGNLDGPQPTRIVFVRQAIARKIDRIEDVRIDDDGDESDEGDDIEADADSGHGLDSEGHADDRGTEGGRTTGEAGEG